MAHQLLGWKHFRKFAYVLVIGLPMIACDSPALTVPEAPSTAKADPLPRLTSSADSDFLMTPAAKAAKARSK